MHFNVYIVKIARSAQKLTFYTMSSQNQGFYHPSFHLIDQDNSLTEHFIFHFKVTNTGASMAPSPPPPPYAPAHTPLSWETGSGIHQRGAPGSPL